ncbi:MAG: nucleotidyltransferase domain-containing protein [Deferrisomatales bacterium]|nr:nucleotidyltransferase domain-containing protein [Deferrisomatales bacterium]
MRGAPESLKREVVRLAATEPRVEKVILFGSRARGDAGERADVDLAVLAPRASQRAWLDLAFRLEEIDSPVPVQVVRLEEVSAGLRERVLEEGEVWYARE